MNKQIYLVVNCSFNWKVCLTDPSVCVHSLCLANLCKDLNRLQNVCDSYLSTRTFFCSLTTLAFVSSAANHPMHDSDFAQNGLKQIPEHRLTDVMPNNKFINIVTKFMSDTLHFLFQ